VRLLLPFLDVEVVDPVVISQNGFNPAAVRELRSLLTQSAGCPAFLATARMAAWIDRQPRSIGEVAESLLSSVRTIGVPGLPNFHTSAVIHFTVKCANNKGASTFAVVMFYVIERFERLMVNTQAAGFTGAFSPESDLPSVYQLLLPFLDVEVVDPAEASRNGFRLSAILELRSLLK
jgi:hypothetical protein